MPDERLNKIMTSTEPADIATLAMIEAMRQIADNGKVTNKALEATNRVLDGMQGELRDVRERVIRIEASEITTDLASIKAEISGVRIESTNARERLRARVEKLELRDAERTGGTKFADALLKYGPFLIALVTALFIVLVATGRVVL